MKIKLAENYGFCFGVKRAIKLAENTQNSATYGPLIHNSKEIDRLKRNFNVSLAQSIDAFKEGDTAVIRTHGIEKEDLKTLKARNVKIVDATCPFVTKPQEIVKTMSEKGYDIVIFGDENHPEIKGVKSYAEGNAYVVLSVEDLSTLHLKERIALISQTTRKVENYLHIANYLIPRYKEVRIFNTICNATFENQEAVAKLSNEADVMIIIGGKNSSNTKQLLSIAAKHCQDSYLVEGPEDLEKAWFRDKEVCGISAGASTPEWVIEQVRAKIEEISL